MPKLLRCRPTHFDVVYKINDHMKVGGIDRQKSQMQWEAINNVYRNLGFDVHELNGQAGLPDMVFAANCAVMFGREDGSRGAIMSRMAHSERADEVPFYELFFLENGYEVFNMPDHDDYNFEGAGDVFYHFDKSFMWGGVGSRTTERSHRKVEEFSGIEVKSLNLVHDAFYHLDTCLCVLNNNMAMAYRPAFDSDGWQKLNTVYDCVIEVSEKDAYNFACNAHSVDGKRVVIQKGSDETEMMLRGLGFEPIGVDTSEFIKSGGSVSCMKFEILD